MDKKLIINLATNIFLYISGISAGTGAIIMLVSLQQYAVPLFAIGIILGVIIIIIDYLKNVAEIKPLNLRYALKESNVSWGYWHAGGRAVLNGAIQENTPTSLKKLLLFVPDAKNESFKFIAKLIGRESDEGIARLIAEINDTARIASSSGVEVLYHTEPITYTFTIFDKTPNCTNINNPTPNSKKAWIVVQPIEPEMKRESSEWTKWIIKNKGDTEGQFKAYYNLFLQIENKIKDKQSKTQENTKGS
jgi:hypothetical protein